MSFLELIVPLFPMDQQYMSPKTKTKFKAKKSLLTFNQLAACLDQVPKTNPGSNNSSALPRAGWGERSKGE